MEFTVNAGAFARALKRASLAVERKTENPLLTNLLITADANLVKIAGSNLFLHAASTVPSVVVTPGSHAVDQQRLLDILTKLPGDRKVTCKLDGEFLIRCGSSRYTMAALSAAEFPAVPKANKAMLDLSAGEVLTLIGATEVAMLQDDQRAHLSGVRLIWADGTITAVATDGMRMSKLQMAIKAATKGEVFMPHLAVLTLRKFCDTLERDSIVSMSTNGAYLHFWSDVAGFACRLVQAPPFDIERVIPKEHKASFKVGRQEFIDALSRLKTVSPDPVLIYCGEGEERIELTSEVDVCSGREAIKGVIKGTGEVRVKLQHLIEMLGVISTDKVEVRISDATVPVVLRPVKGPAFLGLVMPLQG